MKDVIFNNMTEHNQENMELHTYFYTEYFKNEEDENMSRDFVAEKKY